MQLKRIKLSAETGFYSLVDLIARHERNQASKNAALADSVSLRRLDFVELLVENGADLHCSFYPDSLARNCASRLKSTCFRAADILKLRLRRFKYLLRKAEDGFWAGSRSPT
jgi:hypothetical protein